MVLMIYLSNAPAKQIEILLFIARIMSLVYTSMKIASSMTLGVRNTRNESIIQQSSEGILVIATLETGHEDRYSCTESQITCLGMDCTIEIVLVKVCKYSM